jgi:polar amino acid transport system substrate-binding protein
MVAGFIALIVFFSLGLAGCGGQAQQQAKAKDKVLRVGSETTYPPFEFQDAKTKEATGFDIDLIKAVAKQAGYKVKVVGMNFDGLIPALLAKNIDVIASAMTITDERAEKVDFTDPYYKSGQTILVRKDDNSIQSFKDLEGKRIGVQIGTTGADEAKKIKNAKIREYNTTDEANLDLINGSVDAVINDLPVNQYYLAQGGSKDAKLVGELLSRENYGFAVAKGNTKLRDQLNKGLAEVKKSGEYDKIYMKWFGKKP